MLFNKTWLISEVLDPYLVQKEILSTSARTELKFWGKEEASGLFAHVNNQWSGHDLVFYMAYCEENKLLCLSLRLFYLKLKVFLCAMHLLCYLLVPAQW